MPILTTSSVRGFAHCTRGTCPGNEQEPVDVVATETQFLYTDNGGDWGFVERSTTTLAFADPELAVCEHCGGPREVSTQMRPQLEALSGYDPNYLVSKGFKPFSKDRAVEIQDERVKDLEGELAAMKGQMEALLAAVQAPEPEPGD